jgi:DNA-binding beta-propeller fold protein YncE
LKSNFAFLRIAFFRLAVFTMATLLPLTAATKQPQQLNSPQGIAVASNGNLYVANNGGNNVLVYSPTHTQIASKIISENVNAPTSVAFDLNGNLWVANAGSNSITEYNPTTLFQNTVNTIYNGISAPYAIAIDGLNDVLVNNSYETLTIYPASATLPIQSLSNGSTPFTSLATYQSLIAVGSNTNTDIAQISPLIAQFPQQVFYNVPETCFGSEFDSAGNLYCANQDESLTVYSTSTNTNKTLVANIGFFPFGIALDQKRGFVYVSDAIGNAIAIYNTQGDFVGTIKN